MTTRVLLFFISFFLATVCRAAEEAGTDTVVIAGAAESHLSLGQHLRYLQDADGMLTARAIIGKSDSLPWSESTAEVLNFGLSPSPYWFSVSLHNPDSRAVEKLLELSYGLLDYVDFYVVRDGRLRKAVRTGDQIPIDSRPLFHRNLLFPITIPAEATVRILIRVETTGSMQMPLDLWSFKAFFAHDQRLLSLHILFAGIMLALAIYNLFLFFSVREMSYLWYVLSLISIALVTLNLQGVTFQFLWPNWPQLNNPSVVGLVSATIVFSNAFAYTFLRLHLYGWFVRRVVLGMASIGVALFLLNLLAPEGSMNYLAALLAVLTAVILFSTSVYVWRKGDVLARFYTLAWFLLLTGSVLIPLSKIGILPRSLLFEHAQQIGIVAEGLLLSFALAYRINMERHQRFLAQAEVLDVQRRANDELEQRVEDRTGELQLANQKLLEASAIDGLTQVKNRGYFDRTLVEEWSKASRARSPISLLMIDGDYFKRVNDTYGHQCGDACLQHLARIFQKAVSRAGDCVARYGGEEFVILLCNTDEAGARLLGERIRAQVAETPFVWETQSVSLTVSIGVSCHIPKPHEQAAALLKQADEALYTAKHGGRNQVCSYEKPDA